MKYDATKEQLSFGFRAVVYKMPESVNGKFALPTFVADANTTPINEDLYGNFFLSYGLVYVIESVSLYLFSSYF